MFEIPEGVDPNYRINLDGQELRLVLAFNTSLGGAFKLADYPWATYVFVALPGTNGADPERYAQVCQRAGLTTSAGKNYTLAGLWGYPKGSAEEAAWLRERDEREAKTAISVGSTPISRAGKDTSVHVPPATSIPRPGIAAGGASTFTTPATTVTASGGQPQAPKDSHSTYTIGTGKPGETVNIHTDPAAD